MRLGFKFTSEINRGIDGFIFCWWATKAQRRAENSLQELWTHIVLIFFYIFFFTLVNNFGINKEIRQKIFFACLCLLVAFVLWVFVTHHGEMAPLCFLSFSNMMCGRCRCCPLSQNDHMLPSPTHDTIHKALWVISCHSHTPLATLLKGHPSGSVAEIMTAKSLFHPLLHFSIRVVTSLEVQVSFYCFV